MNLTRPTQQEIIQANLKELTNINQDLIDKSSFYADFALKLCSTAWGWNGAQLEVEELTKE